MSLHARVVVDDRGVDATVGVPAGATLALLGPNGSGKSTVLAAIAGTLRADLGEVRLGARVLEARESGVWVPPRLRRIALVTQRADLFPALSVLDNVAYGLRARHARAAHARERAWRWLERGQLTTLADRPPESLSGGQARRVAILRALASEPEALMLDEPFAGVDVEAAQSLRALVAEHAAGVTTVVATHEVLDAHLLASTVTVLDHGRAVETGTTADVLTHPRTEFAAAMAGRRLVRGTARPGAVVLPDGTSVPADTSGVEDGRGAQVAISPLDVRLADATASQSVADTIRSIEPRGEVVRITGGHLSADVPPHLAAGLRAGAPVAFALNGSAAAYAD